MTTENMKKNLIIGLLTLVTVLSIAFGYYQKDRADKNEIRADENERLAREMTIKAEEQQKLAEQQRRIAEMNMVEAMRQREIAETELQKRKGTK
jgi:Tfp pilus assembly protein PilO